MDLGLTVTIITPEALHLRHAPVADCARYGSLRRSSSGGARADIGRLAPVCDRKTTRGRCAGQIQEPLFGHHLIPGQKQTLGFGYEKRR
jgi:hypothetical protein